MLTGIGCGPRGPLRRGGAERARPGRGRPMSARGRCLGRAGGAVGGGGAATLGRDGGGGSSARRLGRAAARGAEGEAAAPGPAVAPAARGGTVAAAAEEEEEEGGSWPTWLRGPVGGEVLSGEQLMAPRRGAGGRVRAGTAGRAGGGGEP